MSEARFRKRMLVVVINDRDGEVTRQLQLQSKCEVKSTDDAQTAVELAAELYVVVGGNEQWHYRLRGTIYHIPDETHVAELVQFIETGIY